ncbi:MAG: hypothetical protein H0Z34_17770 [Brevibacillus sp.]|nr:hypothetical protein [Brevibacillus sp.]
MTNHLSLLLIVAMIGMLCSFLWALEPQEKVRESQEVRVRTAATLTYH